MQVQPILQKIINELAIDCDKFFDEVAEMNENLQEDEGKVNDGRDNRGRVMSQKTHAVGLNKRLLYSQLHIYGVQLDEDEKTLINTVFTLNDSMEKFDYEKLDAAFEGVQSQLYAQGKFPIAIESYICLSRLTVHYRMAEKDLQKDRGVPETPQHHDPEVFQPHRRGQHLDHIHRRAKGSSDQVPDQSHRQGDQGVLA